MKDVVTKEKIHKLLLESLNDRTEYAKAYRQAQENYYDDNVLKDFTGYSDNYIKGYKEGIKDARRGKINDWILKFLTALGDFAGRWNVGNRK